MKALISPIETFTWTWVTSWVWIPEDGDEPAHWAPETTESIDGCQRVAQVQEQGFDVAAPLFWIDCPNDCVPDEWYYKDGQVQPKPQSVEKPSNPPGE